MLSVRAKYSPLLSEFKFRSKSSVVSSENVRLTPQTSYSITLPIDAPPRDVSTKQNSTGKVASLALILTYEPLIVIMAAIVEFREVEQSESRIE
jgi:hypothetical protein